MKLPLIILTFFLLSIITYGQSKNRISITIGLADNGLFRIEELDGTGSYEGKGSTHIGLNYSRRISKIFDLEAGFEYSMNKIEISPAPFISYPVQNTKIKMLTVPIYGRVNFLKYFFVNAGTIVDFEMNYDKIQSTDKQSGIGFGIGIGGEYSIKNITISLNPYFQKHAVVPFKKELYQQRVMEVGIKFGVGYNF